MSDPIKVEKRGPVFEVTLQRGKANAIDLATSRIMGEIFTEFRDDDAMRVALLTASGEKFFCPGWDLKAAADGDAVDGDYGVGGFGGLQELRGLNKPVIAAVNGICCGGGLELALSCDMILAAEHATFALPEIRSGTVADAASIKLPKRIPYHIAMEMLLTGRWMEAEEAARWGLINRIHAADALMDEARALAAMLASGPPLVYAAIKEVVREAEDMKFQDALNRITKSQFETVERLYRSDDQLEAARAFAEKRDPVWKGRRHAFGNEPRGFHHLCCDRSGRHAGSFATCAARAQGHRRQCDCGGQGRGGCGALSCARSADRGSVAQAGVFPRGHRPDPRRGGGCGFEPDGRGWWRHGVWRAQRATAADGRHGSGWRRRACGPCGSVLAGDLHARLRDDEFR